MYELGCVEDDCLRFDLIGALVTNELRFRPEIRKREKKRELRDRYILLSQSCYTKSMPKMGSNESKDETSCATCGGHHLISCQRMEEGMTGKQLYLASPTDACHSARMRIASPFLSSDDRREGTSSLQAYALS